MAKSPSLIGEILHFNSVRFRVTGQGNLQIFLKSLSDVNIEQLTSIPMEAATNIEPSQLANFTDQRGCVEVKTTQINEVFLISRIVVFVRPTATNYPQ